MKDVEISPELGALLGLGFIIIALFMCHKSSESFENERKRVDLAFYKMEINGVVERKEIVNDRNVRPKEQLAIRRFGAQETFGINGLIKGYYKIYDQVEVGDTILKVPDSWILHLKNASRGRNIETNLNFHL